MKKYISNRVREAFKIEKILTASNDAHQLIGEGEQVEVTNAYMEKHDPVVGGYYVRYIDSGYESFCPAEEFEAGNVLMYDSTPADQSELSEKAD